MIRMTNERYAITVDIDWAPDFTIAYLIDYFERKSIKCTWFVTHDTPILNRLRQSELFELGIHPNFLTNSSHGSTENEIIEYCLRLVPEARCVRMHALHQSSHLLKKLVEEYGLQVDASMYVPNTPNLVAHQIRFSHNNKPLTRIPYFWEDDLECYNPMKSWNINDQRYDVNGLKVFNFHPMYIHLNCDEMKLYERLKKEKCMDKALFQLTPEELEPYVNHGHGTKFFFHALVNQLVLLGMNTYTLSELAEMESLN